MTFLFGFMDVIWTYRTINNHAKIEIEKYQIMIAYIFDDRLSFICTGIKYNGT